CWRRSTRSSPAASTPRITSAPGSGSRSPAPTPAPAERTGRLAPLEPALDGLGDHLAAALGPQPEDRPGALAHSPARANPAPQLLGLALTEPEAEPRALAGLQ